MHSVARSRRPESVTVAALLLIFSGTLHLLVATGLAALVAWGRWIPWEAGFGVAAVLFVLGVLSFYAAGGVWHLLPGARGLAVLAAVLGLLNGPLAWPFAGAAWRLLSKASARRALPAHTLRPPAGLRAAQEP